MSRLLQSRAKLQWPKRRVGDLLSDRSYRLEWIEGRDAHRFQRRIGGPEIVSLVGITYSVASAILPRPFLPIKS
jgi:hypothetical protein